MKRSEYEEYKVAVKDFLTRNNTHVVSIISDEDNYAEPHFSWRPCECCDSSLGGNRYDCNFYDTKAKAIFEVTVCEDCIYYVEYGTLDDMTMMDMEEDLPDHPNAELP